MWISEIDIDLSRKICHDFLPKILPASLVLLWLFYMSLKTDSRMKQKEGCL